MAVALQVHDRVFNDLADRYGGHIFAKAGDSFAIAFSRASTAVECAAALQRELAAAQWPASRRLSVRIGLHLGEAEERDDNYFGPAVNLAARVMALAHGGQCLLTDPVRDAAGAAVRDLGTHTVRDIEAPVHLSQLGEETFPPIAVAVSSTVRLPSPRTSLVGRDESVEEVRGLLQRSRLVTLTGVGGCGKTRLAVEVAHREAASHPDGTWFVDLSTIADESGVAGAFASSLGLMGVPGVAVIDQLVEYLATRSVLLVADNCEHVIETVATLLDDLLDRASAVRVLATSRESLEIAGEFAWKVPSLSLGSESAAADLFFERAEAAGAELARDPDTGALVAQIVERLDGIPLAIELAAARTRSMSLADLSARLDDRFRLLSGASRGSRQRQATLEAAVQWSYNLLGEPEQSMLQTLAVFQGGFDVADVAAVAGISVDAASDAVSGLAAKSLVDIRREGTGVLRFRLLETIRLFALTRLVEAGEAAAVRDRHLLHFADDPMYASLEAFVSREGVDRAGREYENLRAAISWALETDRPELAARIATSAHDPSAPRGEADWIVDCLRLPAQLDDAQRLRVKALLAWALIIRGDVLGAAEALVEVIADPEGAQSDFVVIGVLTDSIAAGFLGDVDRRDAQLALAGSLAERRFGPNCQALAGMFASGWRSSLFEFDEVDDRARRIIGSTPGFGYLAVIEAFRVWVLLRLDRLDEAVHLAETFSPTSPGSQWAHLNIAMSHLARAHVDGAEVAAKSLAPAAAEEVARNPRTVSEFLTAFAYLAVLRDDEAHARRLLEVALPFSMQAVGSWVFARVEGMGTADGRAVMRRYAEAYPSIEQYLRAATDGAVLLAAELDRWR